MSFWERFTNDSIYESEKQEIEELISASVRANISYNSPAELREILGEDGDLEIRVIGSESKSREKPVPEEEWIRDLKRKELTDISGSIVFITTELDAQATLWHKNDTIFVNIRGTDTFEDVRNDVCALPKTMTTRSGNVVVHLGFWRHFESLKPFLTEEIERWVNSDRSPIRRICFSSHSLGSAVSQIAAAFYSEEFPYFDVSCFTFGCPRTGDQAFVNWLEKVSKNIRVVNSKDLISMLPQAYWWVHPSAKCIVLSDDCLKRRLRDLPWYFRIFKFLYNINWFSLDEEHRINLYTTRLISLRDSMWQSPSAVVESSE